MFEVWKDQNSHFHSSHKVFDCSMNYRIKTSPLPPAQCELSSDYKPQESWSIITSKTLRKDPVLELNSDQIPYFRGWKKHIPPSSDPERHWGKKRETRMRDENRFDSVWSELYSIRSSHAFCFYKSPEASANRPPRQTKMEERDQCRTRYRELSGGAKATASLPRNCFWLIP